MRDEKREQLLRCLAVSHAPFRASKTLEFQDRTPSSCLLRSKATYFADNDEARFRNSLKTLPWPLPGVSRLRGPPCALSQAPRATHGCNLYPQFSAQVRERNVPQGGVVFQATLRAPSSPGYGMAHLRRRCLGAGPACVRSSRALEPTSFLVARHVTRKGDGPGIPRRETSPPCCEGQRTWVLATSVPSRNLAKTRKL